MFWKIKTLRGTISQLRRPNVPLRLPLFGHAKRENREGRRISGCIKYGMC